MRRVRATRRENTVPSHTPTSLRLPAAIRQAVQMLARQRGAMNAALQRLIDEQISLVSERTIPQRELGALLRALEAALRTYPDADALRNQVVFLPAIPQ
ncbi:MAG: hypothetical protein HY713_07475 [candidate division NC10 bacterium]|nr:hypothetical protein [candidate division NC10 bacterium]